MRECNVREWHLESHISHVKANEKDPKAKFTKHAYDKHRRLLAELPEKVAQRQQNIFNRNQMLASTQAYNLSLENRGLQATSVTSLHPCKKQWPSITWATLTREFTVWRRPDCPIEKLTII